MVAALCACAMIMSMFRITSASSPSLGLPPGPESCYHSPLPLTAPYACPPPLVSSHSRDHSACASRHVKLIHNCLLSAALVQPPCPYPRSFPSELVAPAMLVFVFLVGSPLSTSPPAPAVFL
jgi:hypothetical protein